MPRSRVRRDKRDEIYNKTGGACAYCGAPLARSSMTVDHVTPRALGGTDEIDNLLPCCKTCNAFKGDKTIEQFRKYIANSLDARIFRDKFMRHCVKMGFMTVKHRAQDIQFHFEKIGLYVRNNLDKNNNMNYNNNKVNMNMGVGIMDNERWAICAARKIVESNIPQTTAENVLLRSIADALVRLYTETRERQWRLSTEVQPIRGAFVAFIVDNGDPNRNLYRFGVYDTDNAYFVSLDDKERYPIERVMYWRYIALPTGDEFNAEIS